ncbi:hypothetical protein OG250_16455 [Streptomyces sp. NBC_00487]|uniref:hypothetical protein n=1 Tax=unclassified Streptomyces TaxID=2593676 RepID=UPI002E18E65E|nr:MULTISPECIES: hypothetical protein [unclassified Streptomyces]
MHLSVSRITGVAAVLAGIALGLWVAFGAPRDWHGGMRFLRYALVLGCLGAISGGAKLVFPDTSGDLPDATSREAPDGGSGSRV